jgi:hypothetical protein
MENADEQGREEVDKGLSSNQTIREQTQLQGEIKFDTSMRKSFIQLRIPYNICSYI